MEKQTSSSDRIICTPSEYAMNHYLYAQEVGSLTSLKPHVSSRDELSSFLFLCVEKGHGYFTYRGNRKILLTGDCVFIDCSKGYSHESIEEDPWILKWVHFNGNEAAEYYKQYLALQYEPIFHPEQLSRFTDPIREIYDLYHNDSASVEIYTNCLLTKLIMESFLSNEAADRQANITIEDCLVEKLKQIRQYLAEHLMEELSLDFLSKYFFISKYYLEREYKKEFGITIGNDITMKRISQAKQRLRFTGDSIAKIADDCGFSSSGYFIKVFKKLEKVTPAEYRNVW